MFNNALFQFLVVSSDGYWVSQLMVAIIRYMFVKYPIEIHNYIPNNSDSSYKNLIFCRLLWWSCIINNRKWCINVSATVESPLFSSHSSDSVLKPRFLAPELKLFFDASFHSNHWLDGAWLRLQNSLLRLLNRLYSELSHSAYSRGARAKWFYTLTQNLSWDQQTNNLEASYLMIFILDAVVLKKNDNDQIDK